MIKQKMIKKFEKVRHTSLKLREFHSSLCLCKPLLVYIIYIKYPIPYSLHCKVKTRINVVCASEGGCNARNCGQKI